MPKFERLFLVIFAMLAGAMSGPCEAQSLPAPAIFCAEPLKDFGTLSKGARGDHLFQLENRGSATLSITSAQPSCTCTTVELSRQLVEPGQTFTLRARMDSTPFEGPVEKMIFVASNDPEKPVFPIVLRAQVQNPYLITPHTVHIQSLGRNAELEIPFHIKRADGKTFSITGATLVDLPAFQLDFRPCAGTLEHRFKIRFLPGLNLRGCNGKITLAFDDPELPNLSLPLDARLLEDIGVFPDQLAVGKIAPGALAAQRVLLTIHNPALEIVGVSFEPDVFLAEIISRKAPTASGVEKGRVIREGSELINFSKGVEIRLRTKVDAPTGAFTGRMLIAISGSQQPPLVIPVTGVIEAKGK